MKGKKKGKIKEDTRPDSPRRMMERMLQQLESGRVSLIAAINSIDEGNLGASIAAVQEAQSALDDASAEFLDNVLEALEEADCEIKKIIKDLNG